MFYVYEHIRPDTGKIFYVGKGCKNRAFNKFRNNPYWNNIVSKAGGFEVKFVATDLNEELSLLVEQERIDQLKKLGYVLTNLTNGGGGASGLKHTEKARKGMSDNCCMKRPEIVAKISGAKCPLAKTVEFEGVIYSTMIDLAKYLGITPQCLRSRIFRSAKKYGYNVLGKTKDFK